MSDADDITQRLTQLDHAHVWHPFTAMKQWRSREPVVIERGEGAYLIDTRGRRYIDGVSSLWCNVHGHRVSEIDEAIRQQLDKVAHTTLLGLASPPAIELAAALVAIAPGAPARQGGAPAPGANAAPPYRDGAPAPGANAAPPYRDGASAPGANAAPPCRDGASATISPTGGALNKVFYSDAGAAAVEAALKMAVGYWFHSGQPKKNRFISLRGAYHGDTTGGMSVGFDEAFHQPFTSMVFPTMFSPVPDAVRVISTELANRPPSQGATRIWPSEDQAMQDRLRGECLKALDALLDKHAPTIAGIVIEPVMQGAAGMICQPPGFVRGVAELARKHHTLLIADEVATGFGRTGRMFACEHDGVQPDILCLGKGISGGYLPLAATMCTDEIEQAFCGELSEGRTFFHGHTYTGNALACAAGIASLKLFESTQLLDHVRKSTAIVSQCLNALRDAKGFPHVLDVRQRGLMIGIELDPAQCKAPPADLTLGHDICLAMRGQGLIIRPLGNVLVLMPVLAMPHETLNRMLEIVVETVGGWRRG